MYLWRNLQNYIMYHELRTLSFLWKNLTYIFWKELRTSEHEKLLFRTGFEVLFRMDYMKHVHRKWKMAEKMEKVKESGKCFRSCGMFTVQSSLFKPEV